MINTDPLRFLNEDEYCTWDNLVDSSPYGSLFCKSWWLKAVSDDIRVLAYFDKNRLVAGIPLYFKKVAGITICTMPKLTQTWGVVIEPLSGKVVNINSRENAILNIFAEVLSRFKYFVQNFNSYNRNGLPFYWKGFRQTTHYTYILLDLSDLKSVWAGFRQNIRTDIRKAEQNEVTVSISSPEIVYQIIEKSFSRQDKIQPYSKEYFLKIYNAAKSNNAGECFAAIGSDGACHAAAIMVWDNRRAYYLAGGGDPLLRNSGATSLLIWKMINIISNKNVIFDFEGSMIESVERFFRAFGTEQTTYNQIYKYPVGIELLFRLLNRI